MQKTVVALYDDVHHAQMAVRDLVDSGISRDHISLMANNASGAGSGESLEGVKTTDTSGAAEGAGVGAGIGAALGGIGGLLVGLGALVIPGIGPVLAAGPLAAALGGVAGAGAGAIAGGAAGGLLGALTDMGVNEEAAGYYAEGIRRGGTLLTVRADDQHATHVVDIMNRHNPIDVRNRANEWRASGWSGFSPDASPYQGDTDTLGQERARYGSSGEGVSGQGTGFSPYGTMSDTGERRDYNELRHNTGDVAGTSGTDFTGADYDDESVRGAGSGDFSSQANLGSTGMGTNFATSQGMSGATGYESGSSSTNWDSGNQMGQSQTGYSSGMGNTGATGSRTFDAYDAGFRNHYNSYYGNSGYTYNQYMPAYRFGYDVASNERYQGRDWNDIEMDIRRDWEREHPDNAWDNFKDAIRHSWYEVRNAFR